MTEGSRWYFPVFEGLIEAKHVRRMGPAIWLYLWILARAWVAREGGVIDYTHLEAAQILGRSIRTIKSWFSSLQKAGYIHRRARFPHHLEIEVSNWRTREEWLDSRSEVQDVASLHIRSAERSAERSADLCIPSITIKLQDYEYPSGQRSAKTCLSDAFRDLLDTLKSTANRPAFLKRIYTLCFGADGDQPAYGYLGKVAKQVGGAGRLAELMWHLTTKPPTGDILAYIQAMTKSKRRPQGDEPRGFAGVRSYLEKLEAEKNG